MSDDPILLRNIAQLWPEAAQPRIDNAWLLVRGDSVAGFGPEPAPPEVAALHADVIDLTGHLVTPGFVNTHHHFFQSVTRGLPEISTCGYMDWLAGLYPMWARMTPEDYAVSARVAIGELLLSGVTCSNDFAYLLPDEDDARFDALHDVITEMGLRVQLVRGCMPRAEGVLGRRLRASMGETAFSRLIDSRERMFSGMERAAALHDSGPRSRLRIAFGPTTVTYDDLGLMREIAELAADKGCGLHTHYHPREDEREMTAALFGKSPVELLGEAGWLRPGTSLAHCTRLQEDDIAAFAEHGCGVAHCPRCSLRLGLPIAPVGALRAAGVKFGFGTDGSCANDSGNFLDTLRLALVLHRASGRPDIDPPELWMTGIDGLDVATRGGAEVMDWPEVGKLVADGPADLAAFDLRRLGYAGVGDPIEGFVMAGSHPYADLTIVDGVIRVRDGELIGMDIHTTVEAANAVAARIRAPA